MTLQTLEYFIAVAQYRNFTKAAQACLVTQPALSRAIRTLEEELGCPLLIRAGRTVTLTPEGEVCLAEAKRVLQQCEELKSRVRKAGRENQPPLRIGYTSIRQMNIFIQYVAEKAGAEIPFLMETRYGTVSNAKSWLMSGELDIGLFPEVCIADMKGIEYVHVLKSRLYAIVYKSNSFYERRGVYLSELRDQSFVMWRENSLPFGRAKVFQLCEEMGFVPRVVAEGEKTGDILTQIFIHNAVGVGTAAFGGADAENYRIIPILDSPEQFGVVCVWRKANGPVPLEKLIRILNPYQRNHEKNL